MDSPSTETAEPVLVHCEPGYDCRTDKGVHILHERTYWRSLKAARLGARSTPAQLAYLAFGPEPRTEYWVTDMTYTDKALADQEAKEWDFSVEPEPYADEDQPAWFPIFNDFDKALAFLRARSGINYQPE